MRESTSILLMRLQKKAAAAPPATPKAESGDEGAVATPGTVKKTPRKPRAPPKPFNKLSTALSGAAPVDVTYENETVQSKVCKNRSRYPNHLD